MPDWNRDGKSNRHDDRVFNEIIRKPSEKSSQRSESSGGIGCSISIVIAVVVIWKLIELLAGLMY